MSLINGSRDTREVREQRHVELGVGVSVEISGVVL